MVYIHASGAGAIQAGLGGASPSLGCILRVFLIESDLAQALSAPRGHHNESRIVLSLLDSKAIMPYTMYGGVAARSRNWSSSDGRSVV